MQMLAHLLHLNEVKDHPVPRMAPSLQVSLVNGNEVLRVSYLIMILCIESHISKCKHLHPQTDGLHAFKGLAL